MAKSKFAKMARTLRESPTMHVGNGGFDSSASDPVAGYDVPLPLPELDQDYQTPGQSGLAKWRFSGVYPVQQVGEKDIDDMVAASNEYINLRNEQTQERVVTDRLERMRQLARSIREENILEEPTMSVGAGGYTAAADAKGPVAGFDPKISADLLRRKSLGRWSRSLRKKKGES